MNKLKLFFIIISAISFPIESLSQSIQLPILYIIENDSIWIYPEKLDSIYVRQNKNYIYNIEINSLKGQAYFTRISKKNKGTLHGHFVDALDIFKKYLILPSLLDPKVNETIVEDYYQPLKNSSWIYHHRSGKKTIVVNYSNDAVIEKFIITKRKMKNIN